MEMSEGHKCMDGEAAKRQRPAGVNSEPQKNPGTVAEEKVH